MWADWLGNSNRLTCQECKELAEANGNEVDCLNCENNNKLDFTCPENAEAVKIWQELDLYGRDIDTSVGLPKTLRIEAIEIACKEHYDPKGLKWRIIELESRIYARRVKKFNADANKRKK